MFIFSHWLWIFFFPFTLWYYTTSNTLMYLLAMFTVYLYDYHIIIHSVLAWRIPGMGEPGLPSLESHRVGHNWNDLAAAAAYTLLEFNLLYVCDKNKTNHFTDQQTEWREAPFKKYTYCHVQVTAIIKNIWKLTSVEVKGHLIVKGPWEICHILSLPHSITIQNIFSTHTRYFLLEDLGYLWIKDILQIRRKQQKFHSQMI